MSVPLSPCSCSAWSPPQRSSRPVESWQNVEADLNDLKASQAAALTISGLTVVFDGKPAIDDLSMRIPLTGITSVIGPNGAGKTTLLNAISGFVPAKRGHIRFRDIELTSRSAAARPRLGIGRTFQDLQLFDGLTALENVILGAHVRTSTTLPEALFYWPRPAKEARRIRELAIEILKKFGMEGDADKQASHLPLPSQKLLGLARALAGLPTLLLMDEPAAGMTETEVRRFADVIRRLSREDGVAMLLVEHNMPLVLELSDHIVVMNQGRQLIAGTASEIRSSEEVTRIYLGTRTERVVVNE